MSLPIRSDTQGSTLVNNIDYHAYEGYNHSMLDIPERVAEWAKRLNIEELTADLVNVLYGVPKAARERILEAVNSNHDSTVRLCADSITKYCSPIHRDGKRHFYTETDSLLALVPDFEKTYADFAVRSDDVLPFVTFNSILGKLAGAEDTPENFLYDPLVESHLNDTIHGIMIASLIEDYDARDYKWLGENRERLAPFATVLYERDDVDRAFCELLMEHPSSIADGTL
jgi:hypothetical protein